MVSVRIWTGHSLRPWRGGQQPIHDPDRARSLARDHAVYALDLPGFGRTAKPDRVLDTADLADSLAAWIHAAGPRTVVLLGNSFGCQVIVETVLRHPANIVAAVLQGPTVDPAARSRPAQVWRWLLNAPREPVSLGPVVLRDYLDCGPRRALKTFAHALADRVEDKLPHLDIPVLVVRGERDAIVSQAWAERVTRLLRRGELVIVQGAHTLNYSAPAELADATRSFLKKQHLESS